MWTLSCLTNRVRRSQSIDVYSAWCTQERSRWAESQEGVTMSWEDTPIARKGKREEMGRSSGEERERRDDGVLLYRHSILPLVILLKLLCFIGKFLEGNTKSAEWVWRVNRASIGYYVCVSKSRANSNHPLLLCLGKFGKNAPGSIWSEAFV